MDQPRLPFVRKHYDSGNMGATQKAARDQGVVWLSINSTEKVSTDYMEPAKLAAWLKERHNLASAVLMDEDGTVGRSYNAMTTPHMYIVDPQGVLEARARGLLLNPSAPGRLRAVLHLDVRREDIARCAAILAESLEAVRART